MSQNMLLDGIQGFKKGIWDKWSRETNLYRL